MNSVLLNIALVAVASGLFKMLSPGDNRQIKFMISSFFMVSVIFFATNNDISLPNFSEASAGYYNDYSGTLLRQEEKEITEELNARIRTELRTALEKENIFPEEIYITVNISETSSISISKINFVLQDGANKKTAEKITRQVVGGEAEIVIVNNE